MKKLWEKYREIVLYLVFGVLTTLVGMGTYFVLLWAAEQVLALTPEMPAYHAVRAVAQVVQWVAAVLFAFFTNRKYVFNAEKSGSFIKQLAVFSSGRVVTFFIDYLVTLFGAKALSALLPVLNSVELFGRAWNLNEIGAKLVAAFIVIVSNYFFSKFLVFKKKGTNEQ